MSDPAKLDRMRMIKELEKRITEVESRLQNLEIHLAQLDARTSGIWN